MYCYGVWQPAFDDMDVAFHENLPTDEEMEQFSDGSHCMVILDDLMHEVVQSDRVQRLFVRGSHHKNITVVYVNQNLFQQGKCARTINLNCHYLVLFRNPRDFSQIQYLGRQIGLGKTLVEAYQDCMRERYNYLLVDLSPHSSSKYKLFSHIFPDEDTVAYQPL